MKKDSTLIIIIFIQLIFVSCSGFNVITEIPAMPRFNTNDKEPMLLRYNFNENTHLKTEIHSVLIASNEERAVTAFGRVTGLLKAKSINKSDALISTYITNILFRLKGLALPGLSGPNHDEFNYTKTYDPQKKPPFANITVTALGKVKSTVVDPHSKYGTFGGLQRIIQGKSKNKFLFVQFPDQKVTIGEYYDAGTGLIKLKGFIMKVKQRCKVTSLSLDRKKAVIMIERKYDVTTTKRYKIKMEKISFSGWMHFNIIEGKILEYHFKEVVKGAIIDGKDINNISFITTGNIIE